MTANHFLARLMVPLTAIALATTDASAISAPPGRSTARLSASRIPVTKLQFTNDCRHLLVARGDNGIHGSLECWNASATRIERVFLPDGSVSSLDVDDRGTNCACVAFSSERGKPRIVLFGMRDGRVRRTLTAPVGTVIKSIAFRGNDELIAGTVWPGSGLLRWKIRSGKIVGTYRNPTALQELPMLAVSPDGKYVASGGDTNADTDIGNLRVWSLRTGKQVLDEWLHVSEPQLHDPYAAEEDRLTDFAFSRDSKTLFAACGLLRIYDTKRFHLRQVVRVWNRHEGTGRIPAISIAPDGRDIAVACHRLVRSAHNAGDDVVRIYDIRTGRLKSSRAVSHGEITALAFRPDGKAIAIGYRNGALSELSVH